MRLHCLLILSFLLLTILSCRKDDIRTAAIHVPGLRERECVDIIKNKLEREQTILPSNIEGDLTNLMIYVRYNSLHRSLKNIEFTIAKSGFDANEVPASPEAKAKLPKGCRPSS